MKKLKKSIAIAFASILLLTQVNAFAVGINDFEIGFEESTKSLVQVTTLTQGTDGLTVHSDYTAKTSDLHNLFLSSTRINIKPLSVDFTIDKCTFPNDLANGYLNFNLFKDLAKSKTIGINIMFNLAPVGLSDSFQWMVDNNKFTGDGATKTWVLIQDITGNKINEGEAWTVSEENPNGVPEMGICIDKPYIGPHSFTYNASTSTVVVDGVTVKIQASQASRIGMKDAADLIIQSGGSSYKKEFQYTLKNINGQVVNGKSGSVGVPGATATPTTNPVSSTVSVSGTTSGSIKSSTTTSKDSNATSGEASSTEGVSSGAASAAPTQEQPPLGQNIGTKNLNTRIDMDNKVITLFKQFTVADLLKNFLLATGYTAAVSDSSGKVITDTTKVVDTTMKFAMYFGDVAEGEPDTVYTIAIDASASASSSTDDSPNSNSNMMIYIIIAIAAVVVIGGGLVYFLVIRKKA